jgi:hypothetical protein
MWSWFRRKKMAEVVASATYDVKFKTPYSETSEWAIFSVKKSGGYEFNVAVGKWPTGNCQVTSIAYFNSLLSNTANNKADVTAIIKEMYKMLKLTPLLIIVDVKSQYIAGVDATLEVVHKHPYKSTNGSDMCLYLAKVSG